MWLLFALFGLFAGLTFVVQFFKNFYWITFWLLYITEPCFVLFTASLHFALIEIHFLADPAKGNQVDTFFPDQHSIPIALSVLAVQMIFYYGVTVWQDS